MDALINTLHDYINDCDTTTVTIMSNTSIDGKQMTFTNDLNTVDHNEIIKSVLVKLGMLDAKVNMNWEKGGYDEDWYQSSWEIH